jgi:hypothetical protein
MAAITISFAVGLLLGGWICIYFANRFYRTKIWQAQENVVIAKYNRELAKLNAERAQHELDEDQAISQRIS